MSDHPSPQMQPPTSTIKHELSHKRVVDFLHREIGKTGTGTTGVLIMDLRQTNRMDALTGNVPAHVIKNHTDLCLEKLLRDTDRYANFSGQQVCLVLPELANKDHAVLAATKIISELQKPFTAGENRVYLRPHIGISSFPEFGRDAGQLLMCADIASRIAALDEKGYHVYQLEDQVETESYSGLDVELGKAIKNNELMVYYQPQIEIASGRCVSAEALVRWTTREQQEINPSVLVNVAQNCGLINPLTMLILNTALRHTANFAKAGVNIGISVNLPPKMLEDEELPQTIQQSLDVWNVPASQLTLEITESSIVKNSAALAMLSRLRERGLNLAIDDFGTGYSSLAYLKRFPAQELKIDILFVRSIHNSRGDKQLVRSIIDLAHNFDMITVAEGVEDQATYDLLRDMGCDVIQGYLFSRALPENDFIEWYQHNI